MWQVGNGDVTGLPQLANSFISTQFVNQLGLSVNITGLYRVLTT